MDLRCNLQASQLDLLIHSMEHAERSHPSRPSYPRLVARCMVVRARTSSTRTASSNRCHRKVSHLPRPFTLVLK